MKFHRMFLVMVCAATWFSAGTAMAVGTVPDGDPLPAWETEQEKALRDMYGFPQPESVDAPPSGDVESYAEWAPASGVIVSWMGFEDFLTDMVREFVQVGTSWIVVESGSQQTSVANHLVSEGISLDNVEFLIFNMDSVWMVDYGPFFVRVDGDREIIDHIYDRYGRWNDDEFPENLAGAWSLPFYTSDLRIEGGNFIADGHGICFITDRVIEQNEGYLTEPEVYDRLLSYCGCETVHVLDRINDGTGHIDMFAKLLDEDTMLMGQYDPGDPEYTILENNATYVESQIASTGNNYEVIRIPMPGSPSAYWTYTNSIIVNDIVYVPTYNDPLDPTALSIYQNAMPDHTIIAIDSSGVIGSGGAVHCTTKVVPIDAEYNANVQGITIVDNSGDADGILDPGETASLVISLRNAGINTLSGVSGSLSCQETQYVSIPIPDAVWPDIPAPGSASCLLPYFQVIVDNATPEGTVLNFDLDITADNYTDTESFTLVADVCNSLPI
ncbi:MAG TPA: agmatine deiminase family protein, partial [bacterium]|nr:agmatine deiminase family protein [bacterium]